MYYTHKQQVLIYETHKVTEYSRRYTCKDELKGEVNKEEKQNTMTHLYMIGHADNLTKVGFFIDQRTSAILTTNGSGGRRGFCGYNPS